MRTRIALAVGLIASLLAPAVFAAPGRITDATAIRSVKQQLDKRSKWSVTLEGRKNARTRGFTAVNRSNKQRTGAVDMSKKIAAADRVTIFRTSGPLIHPTKPGLRRGPGGGFLFGSGGGSYGGGGGGSGGGSYGGGGSGS